MGDLHGIDRPPRWRLRLAAAAVSAVLSGLFLLVYGATNWITSLRSDVGTWYFEWERNFPFVPWLILPYLSIDAFFVAAPFLCRDLRELRMLAARLSLAIIAAGACFLVLPLRFAFDQPRAAGWMGDAFDAFRQLDRPFNLFPSLHIALRTILAEHFSRHTRSVIWWAVYVWFALVGLSTVLTYQHHVMDVVGGFMLAGFCFHAFPPSRPRLPVTPNYRIAAYYGVGSILLIVLALSSRPCGILLLWPAVATAIVAAAYAGCGPGAFRKTNGRLPWSTRFTLGPVLLGQCLSLLYYRRQCRPWDAVTSRVWIGRRLREHEAAGAVSAGVLAVLDLTAEFEEVAAFRSLAYRNLPILDLTAPTPAQLDDAVAFIARHAAHGIVYVHCKIGYSRSAAALAAWLIASGEVDSLDAAIARLRAVRPTIIIRPEALAAVRAFAARVPSPPDPALCYSTSAQPALLDRSPGTEGV